uniref:Uncharacterized protein n=1 Tax=Grammatophora oceanica TaxID=210454 RepID=A0A7S1YD82_9STRA|mmetsp:Transcript_44455/g.65979  ORF Transcript_44455/g.65979 Transcript_44455/m.65979 type:complete len:224 (+) Transcript_44455:117-788(+)
MVFLWRKKDDGSIGVALKPKDCFTIVVPVRQHQRTTIFPSIFSTKSEATTVSSMSEDSAVLEERERQEYERYEAERRARRMQKYAQVQERHELLNQKGGTTKAQKRTYAPPRCCYCVPMSCCTGCCCGMFRWDEDEAIKIPTKDRKRDDGDWSSMGTMATNFFARMMRPLKQPSAMETKQQQQQPERATEQPHNQQSPPPIIKTRSSRTKRSKLFRRRRKSEK